MHNPDCEAAFKRMLQVGLITTLYDHAIFPTAEADRAAYEVRNEKGKVVPIPHPVSFLGCFIYVQGNVQRGHIEMERGRGH